MPMLKILENTISPLIFTYLNCCSRSGKLCGGASKKMSENISEGDKHERLLTLGNAQGVVEREVGEVVGVVG